MKKIKLMALAGALCAFFLTGCADLNEKNETSGGDRVTFNLSDFYGRAVYALGSDYSLDNVAGWTITFEPVSNSSLFTTLVYETSSNSGLNVTYDSTKKTLSAESVPSGAYNVTISGTYNDSKVVGTLENFKVSPGSVSESIHLVPKNENASDTSTGSLEMTFSISNLDGEATLSADSFTGYFKAVLTPLGTPDGIKTIELSDTSSKEESTDTFTFDSENSLITLKWNSIPPGWYALSFEYGESYGEHYYVKDSNIQIGYGTTTTASSVELCCARVKKYYVTNKSSDEYSTNNGLSKASKANLSVMLEKMADSLPDFAEVDFVMADDEEPEVDVDLIENLVNAARSTTHAFTFKLQDSYKSELLNITTEENTEGGGYTATVAIVSSLTLTSSTAGETLNANIALTSSGTVLTLKNGVNIEAGSVTLSGENDSLGFKLLALDGSDNLGAYIQTPVLTGYTSNLTDTSGTVRAKLLDSDGKELSDWEVYETGAAATDGDRGTICSLYVKPQTSLNRQEAEASIVVYDSATGSTFTDGELPYRTTEVTFKLTGCSTEPDECVWAVNGSIIGDGKITPNAENSPIKTDDSTTNTVTCYCKLDGKWYYLEENLTLTPDYSTQAVYVDINAKLSAIDYSDEDSEASTLKSNFYFYQGCFTFGQDGSLYAYYSGTIYKYTKNLDDTYSATAAKTVTLSSSSWSNPDICYDVVNKIVYFMGTTNAEVSTTTILPYRETSDSFTAIGDGVTVSVPEALQTIVGSTFSKIAVYGNKVYLATSSGYVVGAEFAVDVDNSTVTMNAGSLTTVLLLSDYAPKLLGSSWLTEKSGFEGITDLMIGDGCGNYPDTLYVLTRQVYCPAADNTDAYSRGALIEVDLNTKKMSDTLIGLATAGGKFSYAQYQYDGYLNGNYYGPGESETNFYGPVYFACVMPKKLIIADNGFTITDGDAKNDTLKYGKAKNKDAVFEYDIAEKSLSQKKSITIEQEASGSYWQTEN